ncbi:MAG: methyltransferase domain-containing protein [Chloroflexi bacterium]|nr:methyltransferase domain-containing protein [Chloroflexota bacterium]
MNYPHVSLFPGHIEVRATPEDFESPFERLRELQAWHSSSLDRIHPIWTRDDKVCLSVDWSRYGEDGTRYLSGNIIYIVTNVEGHWGIQFRARSEPRDRDGPPPEAAAAGQRPNLLTLVPEEIEEFARRHTTPLPPHLEELARFTLEEMEYGLMLSGPIEGGLLQFLAWATGAKRVLELGCFTGFSAQMLAAELPDDGEVITCEIDRETAEIARRYADEGPDGQKIEIRVGPALETLETLEGPFDLVFIDADKNPYIDYYEASLELLADKGIIAVDNVLLNGRVTNPESRSGQRMAAFNAHVAADPRVKQVLLPVRDGVMLIRRA